MPHRKPPSPPASAPKMVVGEQPDDQEDLAGLPFVGPAGHLLDALFVEAGVDRAGVYVTNAVKHFKWEPRGKRRLHKTPAQPLRHQGRWIVAVYHPSFLLRVPGEQARRDARAQVVAGLREAARLLLAPPDPGV